MNNFRTLGYNFGPLHLIMPEDRKVIKHPVLMLIFAWQLRNCHFLQDSKVVVDKTTGGSPTVLHLNP